MNAYNEKELREAVKNNNTLRSVLIYFKKNDTAGQYKTLHNYIEKFEIDTSHFFTQKDVIKNLFKNGKLSKKNDNEIFCENSKVPRNSLKKRFLERDEIEEKCFDCGQNNIWRGKKISLILDHINGKNNDNRIENLRLLCPNCNSTLETHCLGFNRLEKKNNKKLKKEKKIYKYVPRLKARKVERPTLEQLLKDVEQKSYVEVGKKYGVSDVLIRKWIVNFGGVPPKKQNKMRL